MNKDLKLLVTGFVTLLISIVLFVATIVIFAVQLGKTKLDKDRAEWEEFSKAVDEVLSSDKEDRGDE